MTTLRKPEAPTVGAEEAPPVARRHFLSWVRDGVAGRLPSSAADPGSGPLPARALLGTGLTVNGVEVPGPELALHGPGDAVGLDPRQLVRLEPPDRTTDFEPEHLAAVDFDDPALPWRLTPAAPHPERGLRPWLVLIAVDLGVDDVRLDPPSGGPLPVLTVPRSELPDLAQSAAWAHAEITVVDGEDLLDVLRNRPERSVSRLLAPRALAPDRRYLACLVPAFAHGVAAGLGLTPEGTTTDPAWEDDDDAGTATLPVYHSWTFGTGPSGDFPTLAGRLRPAVPDSGKRTFSYRDADPQLTAQLSADPGLTTVLPALHAAGAAPDGPVPAAWQEAMRGVLARGDTEVIPPIYLAAHTGHGRAWTGDEPPWMVELNSDPRLRAAAGLGAEVVQRNQEALMSAAWRQAAELDAVNRELARGQLGRTVSESLHRRHFAAPVQDIAATADAAAVPGVLVSRSAAALRRIPVAGGTGLAAAFATAFATAFDKVSGKAFDEAGTVAGGLDAHPATAGTVAPSVQRVLRPTGPVAKAAGASTTAPLGSAVAPVAAGEVVPAPAVAASQDTGVLDRVAGDNVQYRGITRELVEAALPWWRGWSAPDPGNRPLATPGQHGYLADHVVVDQAPAEAGGAITVTVHREIDFDGRVRRPGTPFPLPHPAGAPAALRLCGASLVRGYDAEPALLLLLANGSRYYYPPRQHYARWVYGLTATGYREASPLVPLGEPYETSHSMDITVRRTTTYENEVVQEVLMCWPDQLRSELLVLCVRTQPWSGPPGWTDLRHIPMPWGDPENSPGAGWYAAAVDWLPKPFHGTHQQPTDLLVAWLVDGMDYSTGETPIWRLQFCIVRNALTPQLALEPVHESSYLGERETDGYDHDEHWPRLAVTVTDLDGNGKLEVLVRFTRFARAADGTKTWSTLQHVAAEIDPATGAVTVLGRTTHPDTPAGPVTVHVTGDVSERRLTRLSQIGDRFQTAAAAHQARLVRPATEGAPPPGPAPYSVSAVAAEVTGSLDPAATIPNRVLDRVSTGGAQLPAAPAGALAGGGELDPLRPRRYEPVFRQPMSEPLRALYPELTFPAADAMPMDGVALMAGNAELIAAYLAGLNDEFGRELLWRAFPSGGRATWFRRFFDTRGATGETGDVLDIADWGGRALGDVVTGLGAEDSVTLLVRGQLVRRFPNVVVQAVEAVWSGSPARREPLGAIVAPAFTGTLGPDLTVFNFRLTADELRGDPGWFFVFAEPPTQSRFGGAGPDAWTRPGAHTAAALLRLPYRVAVHASDLLPQTQGVRT